MTVLDVVLPFVLVLNVATAVRDTTAIFQTTNETSGIMMCSPVCARCMDGSKIAIMRELDKAQFGQMLTVQGIILTAQVAANIAVPGGPHIGMGLGHLFHAISNAAANKAVDMGLQRAVDYTETLLAGEDKCNSVAVLTDRPWPILFPFGLHLADQSLRSFLLHGHHLFFHTIDPPLNGQRARHPQDIEMDLWRKNVDDILDLQRQQEGQDYFRRSYKSFTEWLSFHPVELPLIMRQILHYSDLYCGRHGGLYKSFYLSATASLPIKFSEPSRVSGLMELCEEHM
mmetsp:Transcript_32742/g.94037  ORF Transcript_32742/g.94037 Transcript_32742/m.94037 type:complete len:285 (+) Transcript_32742:65-919(+)